MSMSRSIYNCELCKYNTENKNNYKRHLISNKHLNKGINIKKSTELIKSKNYQCQYCLKEFTLRQSLNRHINNVCKRNDYEDMKQLINLLNEQIEIKNNQINDFIKQNDYNQKQNEVLQKQIELLSNKLDIKNKNLNNNFSKTNEVKLVDFDDTDYNRISNKQYNFCLMKCNMCISLFIEHVHFNKKYPENMNIYISNLNNKYVMLYNDSKWQVVDRNEVIDNLIDNIEVIFRNWLSSNDNLYCKAEQMFDKYLANQRSEKIFNRMKQRIILMLYNKRDIVNANKIVNT